MKLKNELLLKKGVTKILEKYMEKNSFYIEVFGKV